MAPSVVNRSETFKQFTPPVQLLRRSELLQVGPMAAEATEFGDTNDEVQRMRLKELCATYGGLQAVAERVQTHWQYLDQVLKRRLLKPRKDGTQKSAALGEDLARRIEQAYELPAGWLDWPLTMVPFDVWARMSLADRSYVQGVMVGAMKDRGLMKEEPDGLVNKAVTAVEAKQRHAPMGVEATAALHYPAQKKDGMTSLRETTRSVMEAPRKQGSDHKTNRRTKRPRGPAGD